jgi:restriction endonuclease S subunit
MRDDWTEAALGDAVEFCRSRIDPLALDPNELLRHWSIPVLDETGGPRDEPAKEIGSHKFRVEENAVVFSLLNPRIPRFALVVGGENVVCSTEFAVMRPGPRILEDFLLVLASSDVFHGIVNSLANGTTKSRERVKSSDLENVSVLLPPLTEQRRIVDVVSSVDAYIDALQQQADTARTARNAVLHELLSAGGDDWTETTLGDIAKWSSGKNLALDKRDDRGLIPILGANGVIGRTNEVLLDEELITVGRVGACGETHRFSGPVWVSDNALIVTPLEVVVIDWLFYFLSTFNYQAIISGTTQPLITQTKMKNQVVNLPPLEKQKRIVEIVSSMDEVIQATVQAVADAKNLRSGLLSDLLSGEHEIPESYDVFLGAA